MQLTRAEQAHHTLLERWRGAMDLIGPGPSLPHFEDAARGVSGLDAVGDWADLGSGAGFPGIALAARWPGARVEGLDSSEEMLRKAREEPGRPNWRLAPASVGMSLTSTSCATTASSS